MRDGHDLVDLARPGSTTPGRCRSAQPPAGGGPATATSPPRLTSAPLPIGSAMRAAARSAASALAVEPRSRRTPRGMRTVRSAGLSCTCCVARHRTRALAAGRRGGTAPRPGRRRSRARRWRCRWWGRRRRRCARRRRRATASASKSSALTCTVRPALACTACSSESARNRLQARSMASSSAASRRSAASASAASCTTTVAVVPMARKERVVSTGSRGVGVRRHAEVPPDVTEGVGELVRRRRGRRGSRCCRCCPCDELPDCCRCLPDEPDVVGRSIPVDVTRGRGAGRAAGAGVVVGDHDPDGHRGARGGDDGAPGQGAQPGLWLWSLLVRVCSAGWG